MNISYRLFSTCSDGLVSCFDIIAFVPSVTTALLYFQYKVKKHTTTKMPAVVNCMS